MTRSTPRRLRAVAITASVALGLIQWAHAGDLQPPPGPIQPTMKSLQQIESRTPISLATTPGDADSLYRITQPGAYYLTGPITGVALKSGIEIAAPDVTIDLRGYTMTGVLGSLSGIQAAAGINDATILNGNIEFWGFHGIGFGAITNTRIERVRVSGNANIGMQLGDNAVVIDCSAWGNVGIGISVGGGNGNIRGCNALLNGATGIRMLNGGVIENCTAREQAGDGFIVGEGVTVRGSSAYLNSGNGFSLSNGSSAIQCTAANNTLDGFLAGNACSLIECTARNNTQDGIEVGANSSIRDCTVSLSSIHGIKVSAECLVQGCHVSRAGNAGDGAAIFVTGMNNRISDNSALTSDRGIDVDAAGGSNVIVRNTATGNTVNYEVAMGNVLGPVVTSGTVSTDTNPHANYE